jgi:hypothetical protein
MKYEYIHIKIIGVAYQIKKNLQLVDSRHDFFDFIYSQGQTELIDC